MSKTIQPHVDPVDTCPVTADMVDNFRKGFADPRVTANLNYATDFFVPHADVSRQFTTHKPHQS